MNIFELAKICCSDIERIEVGFGFEQIIPSRSLISVIVPSFNHEAYVKEALISLANQTYEEVEIILVDDGSSDDTFDRALRVLKDGRRPFVAIRKRNEGLVPTINAGILMSRGRWISFLASDDAYYPGKLSLLERTGNSNDAHVVLGLVDQVANDGAMVYRGSFAEGIGDEISNDELRYRVLCEHLSLPLQGVLLARTVFSRIGLFTPGIYTEDFDFTVRIASAPLMRIAFVPIPVAIHRNTRQTLSKALLDKGKQSFLEVIRIHSRNAAERRIASSNILVEVALNKVHYGYPMSGLLDLFHGFVIAPATLARILFARARGRVLRKLAAVKLWDS